MLGAVYPLAFLPVIPDWWIDEIMDMRTEQYARPFHRFIIGSPPIWTPFHSTPSMVNLFGWPSRATDGSSTA